MTRNRTGRIIWGLLVVLLAICAAAARKDKAGRNQAKPASSQTLTIQEIQATADKVTIQANGSLTKATPFILGDPIRLMIDFRAATVAANVPASIPVNGDLIQAVQVITIPGSGAMTSTVRLQLDLAKDIVYQLQPSGNTLVVALTPHQEKAPPGAISEDMYKQAKEVEETLYATGHYTPPPSGIQMPPAAALNQPEASAPAATQPMAPGMQSLPPPTLSGAATQVVDILFRSGEHRLQILIKTNGAVGKYSPFTLDKPNRLAIDLPRLKESAHKTSFAIGQSGVKQVRLGAYPDKTRVVIDFAGPIPKYSFSVINLGLVVTLNLP